MSDDNRHVYGWQVLGGEAGSPFAKANEQERKQALAIVECYVDRQTWTAEELAETYGCREHQVRNARWLAISAGLLRRDSRGGFKVTAQGRGEDA